MNAREILEKIKVLRGAGLTWEQVEVVLDLLNPEDSQPVKVEYFWDQDRTDPWVFALRGGKIFKFRSPRGGWESSDLLVEESDLRDPGLYTPVNPGDYVTNDGDSFFVLPENLL